MMFYTCPYVHVLCVVSFIILGAQLKSVWILGDSFGLKGTSVPYLLTFDPNLGLHQVEVMCI